ncbi:hypothetical protein [Rahnella sp. AN3-3W3]|uniref:hypothetical protein n=1 Tax=Rahnella sp. AN3-3W3 TaxID=1610578 RepID=UPI00130078FA|nr:hypothetical protein [Rahnella sp. AN3-3W3]
MKKTHFTEEQMVFELKQAPGSGKSAERWGFLKPFLYLWTTQAALGLPEYGSSGGAICSFECHFRFFY